MFVHAFLMLNVEPHGNEQHDRLVNESHFDIRCIFFRICIDLFQFGMLDYADDLCRMGCNAQSRCDDSSYLRE